MSSEARDIYQRHLDEVSVALWNRDYDAMVHMLAYPHSIRLPDLHRYIKTPEDQLPDARAFRESMQSLGATSYHRVCRKAAFDPEAPGFLDGEHITYVMRGGSYVVEPLLASMRLRKTETGVWKSQSIEVSVRNKVLSYYHPDNYRRGADRSS